MIISHGRVKKQKLLRFLSVTNSWKKFVGAPVHNVERSPQRLTNLQSLKYGAEYNAAECTHNNFNFSLNNALFLRYYVLMRQLSDERLLIKWILISMFYFFLNNVLYPPHLLVKGQLNHPIMNSTNQQICSPILNPLWKEKQLMHRKNSGWKYSQCTLKQITLSQLPTSILILIVIRFEFLTAGCKCNLNRTWDTGQYLTSINRLALKTSLFVTHNLHLFMSKQTRFLQQTAREKNTL